MMQDGGKLQVQVLFYCMLHLSTLFGSADTTDVACAVSISPCPQCKHACAKMLTRTVADLDPVIR